MAHYAACLDVSSWLPKKKIFTILYYLLFRQRISAENVYMQYVLYIWNPVGTVYEDCTESNEHIYPSMK